ncbi:MAG: hypothetical protein RH980_18290 [Roseovarius confluentis]|jgi:starvation-inducible outer membrane lipoprotein
MKRKGWMMSVRRICVAALMLSVGVGLAACATAPRMTAGTETERERCRAWRDSLPSRSSTDTAQTQDEIGVAYDVFLAACPGFDLSFF